MPPRLPPSIASHNRLPRRAVRACFLPLLACLLLGPATAASAAVAAMPLKKLSLAELMEIEVVSVSRRAQKLSETAAAAQLVSQEDIRRSGAVTLPQALRLASNLQVAQVNTGYWAIGARGFNSSGTTSNKLLVMIDGRSVYTPLFSGVFWDTQDVFLPDVDHIEVISGPGGSSWGANAMNGVISIISKRARDTQGGVLYAGAGMEERGFAGLRYGGAFGQSGHYRIYAKHMDFDGTERTDGTDAGNRWVFSQTGFRADWAARSGAFLTLQGDLYTGWLANPVAARGELDGGNLLGRWTQPLPGDSTLTVQTYFDSARRTSPVTFADRLDTVDIDAQHDISLFAGRHRFVWGVGYRASHDRVRNLPNQAFIPAEFTHRLGSVFVQDQVELVPERLRLTLGTKFEHNNYSGSDLQPSVRLAWLISPEHTAWASVSRAVRTPSRVDRDLFIPPQPPFALGGGPNFDSEILWAYELGWRGRFGQHSSFSTSVFSHDYDGLRSLEPTRPLVFANGIQAKTYGTEIVYTNAPTPWFNWNVGYTFLKRDLQLKPWSGDLNRGTAETSDPEHQVQLRGSIDFARVWEFDFGVRRISTVPTFAGGVQNNIPAYTELDARLSWHIRDSLEWSLVGRNLLDGAHPEIGAAPSRREIERSLHTKIDWRF